jgi:hypothetical protein
MSIRPPKIIERVVRTVADPETYNWVYVPKDSLLEGTDNDAYRQPLPFKRMVVIGHAREDGSLMGYTVEAQDERLLFTKIQDDNRRAFPTIQIDVAESNGLEIEFDRHPDMTHVNMEPYDPAKHRSILESEVSIVHGMLCAVIPALQTNTATGVTVYKARKDRSLINKKREQKGKPPVLVWSTISLQSIARERPDVGRESSGEVRTSPREHERRGHFRTYKNGRQVWIGPMVINKGSERGRVAHMYKVEVEG